MDRMKNIPDSGNKYNFYYNMSSGLVICAAHYKGKIVRGVSKCCPEDTFNLDVGKELAYLRCKQKLAERKYKHANEVCTEAKAAVEAATVAHRKAELFAQEAYDKMIESEIALSDFVIKLEEDET